MKTLLFTALSFLFITGCNTAAKNSNTTPLFAEKKGCFILYNMKTNSYEKVIGNENCQIQYPACSSFKVPLAVIGFDSGVLKNDKTLFKWDGKPRSRVEENKNQTAQSWMTNSVVWYSQVITKKLGEKKLQFYLDTLNYGNKDLKGGLTEAWLHSPDSGQPSLKVTAYQQVDFMKKLWLNQLPVSERAIELTKKITYLETSPKGFKLSGKTGSNSFAADTKKRLGWFIAHIEGDNKEYIAITNFIDLVTPTEGGYGGPKAKEMTKQLLAEHGLW